MARIFHASLALQAGFNQAQVGPCRANPYEEGTTDHREFAAGLIIADIHINSAQVLFGVALSTIHDYIVERDRAR